MTDQMQPLTVLLTGWKGFQARLNEAIAPLTAEQLALPVAAHHWTIGAVVQHIVADRVWWFHGWLGEGDAALANLAAWDPNEPATPPPTPAELVAALNATWQLVEGGLTRWSADELADAPQVPANVSEGERRAFGGRTRQWIIWHVVEHELLHAGEVSLALGAHGLSTIRPI